MPKLEDAALCMNCEEIFSKKDFAQCPKCLSEAVYSLLLWVVPVIAVCVKKEAPPCSV